MAKKISLFAIGLCCMSVNAYSAPQHCYSDGEKVTLQGTASARPLAMANRSVKSVWILNTTKPICVIERDAQKITDVSNIQIVGSPPPMGAVIELKGTLSTENITQSYAEPTAIQVTSGRRLSETNSALETAQISCEDMNYDNPNYHKNMDRLAIIAKLRDGYWSRYHEDIVSDLCKNNPEGVNQTVKAGYATVAEAEAITQTLGKQYNASSPTIAAAKNSVSPSPASTPSSGSGAGKLIGIIILLALAAWLLYKNGDNLYRYRDRIKLKPSSSSRRLLTCKDCGKEYSRDAKRCIHCGARKPASSGQAAAVIIIALLIFGIFSSSKKQLSPAEQACADNWRLCQDNSQLANTYGDYSRVQAACEIAAENAAKYGKPEFPMLSFSSFHKGRDYVETGIVYAYENNAKFQNGFGAMAKSSVMCAYDLNKREVINISINGL